MSQYQSFPDADGASRTFDKLMHLKLPSLAGRTFLDVGCNEGFFCGFARFDGATRVVGIDKSALFIERARARFPEAEFLQQGWDDLPEGPFDVILLASALHYAHDQPALIARLVERLSSDGVLVLELGIAPSKQAEWVKVKRGIDEREFPSMLMLREVLADYAWKWMGPSVSQDGDPVARHVVHICRRRPVAYLLMAPPGHGKTSVAKRLFGDGRVRLISGDHQIGLVAQGRDPGRADVAPELREAIVASYSPFTLDQTIQDLFDRGMGSQLVDLWLAAAGDGDFALDVYVPAGHHAGVEQSLRNAGYLPVRLDWEPVGPRPQPDAVMQKQAEAFYLSQANGTEASASQVADAPKAMVGFVDEADVKGGRLVVRGWAVDRTGATPELLRVRIGAREVEVDAFEKQLRPDVQRALGLGHALLGFRASVPLLAQELPFSPGQDVLAVFADASAEPLPMSQALGQPRGGAS